MKKLMFVAMFVLLSSIVLAAMDIQQSTLDFGSSSQVKFDGSGCEGIELTEKNIDLENEGSYPVNNTNYTFTGENGYNENDIQLNVFDIAPTLNNGASDPVKVKITIPEDFDAVNDNLGLEKFAVGKLKFVAYDTILNTTVNSDEVTLNLQVKNEIEINSVKLDDGDTESDVSEGNTKNVEAGKEVELKIQLKNNFDSNTEVDLQNIEVTVSSNGLDVDESENVDDMPAEEESDEVSIKFDIDKGESTGEKNVEITVEADDECGGKHGDKLAFKINVQEPQDEGSDDTQGATNQVNMPQDSDNDGVDDLFDQCPNTPTQCKADFNGCPYDSDNDGTCNEMENSQSTLTGSVVQKSGQSNKNTEKDEGKSTKDDGSSGFVPFAIGFVIGIVITAAFFMVIKT